MFKRRGREGSLKKFFCTKAPVCLVGRVEWPRLPSVGGLYEEGNRNGMG